MWEWLMEAARHVALSQPAAVAPAQPLSEATQCLGFRYSHNHWEQTGEERWYEGQWVMQLVHYQRTRFDNCDGTETIEHKTEGPFRLWQAVPDRRISEVNHPSGPVDDLNGTPLRSSESPAGRGAEMGPQAEIEEWSSQKAAATTDERNTTSPYMPSLALLVGILVAVLRSKLSWPNFASNQRLHGVRDHSVIGSDAKGWFATRVERANRTLKKWVFGEDSEQVSWAEEAKACLGIGWMWVREQAPRWWPVSKNFARGLAYEVINNLALDVPDVFLTKVLHRETDDDPAFKWGRAFGAAAALIGGVAEVLIGLGGTLGSGAGIILSGGTASPVLAPAGIASLELVFHGTAVIVFAAKNVGGRLPDAVAASRSKKQASSGAPPDSVASDPEVVEPLDPNWDRLDPAWKRHQKNVTGRSDVAEIKGKIQLDGKIRRVQWDDLQVNGQQWWGVDAKHVEFSKPWYKSRTHQRWALKRWEGQMRRQRAWADKHDLAGVKWVFSEQPPPWFMRLAHRYRIRVEVQPLPPTPRGG